MNRGRKIILWTLLLGTVGILALFFSAPVEPFTGTSYSPALYARDGTLLSARLASDGQWRFACGDPLPERYKTAVIEQEDRRFRRHPGVDPLALIRALVSNLEAGRVVSGGSTITMQLARLEGHRPRTIGSKIREAVRAIRLETGRSKDNILSWYGCQVPMGGNIVGVETAAWGYFGRSSKELSWAESALLAVLPNDPALIYPGRQHDRLKQKRDRLLERLFRRGIISELDRDLAVAEPVPERALGFPRKASYLLDTLADTSASRSFQSTIDTRTQGIAQRIFDQDFPHFFHTGKRESCLWSGGAFCRGVIGA